MCQMWKQIFGHDWSDMKAIQAILLYFDGYIIECQYYVIFSRLNINVDFGSCQYPSPGIISLTHGSTELPIDVSNVFHTQNWDAFVWARLCWSYVCWSLFLTTRECLGKVLTSCFSPFSSLLIYYRSFPSEK
jgi:hypothetical protein